MALQELATNAVKYGALSNDAGQVRVAWSKHDGVSSSLLRLVWSESGGPPVDPPERRGFGTTLIERSFASEVEGKATLRFEREGLICEIDAPVD